VAALPIAGLLLLAVACGGSGSGSSTLSNTGGSGGGPPTVADHALLPLTTGNTWDFGSFRVEVTGTQDVGGETYAQVSALASRSSNSLLRVAAGGQVQEIDPAGTASPTLWYLLDAAVSTAWTHTGTTVTSCNDGVSVSVISRSETVTVPAGTFTGCLLIRFGSGPCADGGTIDEYFAPGVGMVKRVEQTIAGPRALELQSAVVNGATIP
jgi:hypothetical protein